VLSTGTSSQSAELDTCDVEEDGPGTENAVVKEQLSYKPLQLSAQLSGFPNLHMLYSIFCCLPVGCIKYVSGTSFE